VLRDLFLGFIRIHILHHAALDPVYGAAMQRELARHGYEVSPGTLYPVLHGLQTAGYLEKSERVVNGRVRKYYAITADGLKVLAEARAKARELALEVVEGEGPRSLHGSGDE
jgi:DNA-binding PadR family transcriptional regulator